LIGWQELILILAIVLLVFGPKKLPVIAKELGKTLREFQRATSSVEEMAHSALKGEEEVDRRSLTEIARKLNVSTEGKSTEQLINEITSALDTKKEIEHQ